MSDREQADIWVEILEPRRVSLGWAHYPWQNSTRIRRRAERLARLYQAGRNCRRCYKLIPVWKRVDAKYCCESCRKLAARERRGLK